jgi:hypothetical protein
MRQRLRWTEEAVTEAMFRQEEQRRGQDTAHTVVHRRLAAGAVVFLREMAPEHKLAHKFVGPFFVVGDAPTAGGVESGSANYILRDEQGRQLQKSFPRAQLFEVVQEKVVASLRQTACYTEEDLEQLVEELAAHEPGPLSFDGPSREPQFAGEVPGADFAGEDMGRGVQQEGDSKQQPRTPWFAVEGILGERLDKFRRPMVLVKWVGYQEPQWIPASDVDADALRVMLRDYHRTLREGGGVRGRLSRVTLGD